MFEFEKQFVDARRSKLAETYGDDSHVVVKGNQIMAVAKSHEAAKEYCDKNGFNDMFIEKV
jgi:hypothetical protein